MNKNLAINIICFLVFAAVAAFIYYMFSQSPEDAAKADGEQLLQGAGTTPRGNVNTSTTPSSAQHFSNFINGIMPDDLPSFIGSENNFSPTDYSNDDLPDNIVPFF